MTVTVRYCIDGHRKFVDFPMNSMVIFHSYVTVYQRVWATVNIWYIAPSHHFLKNVFSFFNFWYISEYYSLY